MAVSLDPHSNYDDAKSFQDAQVQTRTAFGGVGIDGVPQDKPVKVDAAIDETPAARAGLQSGDVITAIDGASTAGHSLGEAVKTRRGAINAPVKLTIQRGQIRPPSTLRSSGPSSGSNR